MACKTTGAVPHPVSAEMRERLPVPPAIRWQPAGAACRPQAACRRGHGRASAQLRFDKTQACEREENHRPASCDKYRSRAWGKCVSWTRGKQSHTATAPRLSPGTPTHRPEAEKPIATRYCVKILRSKIAWPLIKFCSANTGWHRPAGARVGQSHVQGPSEQPRSGWRATYQRPRATVTRNKETLEPLPKRQKAGKPTLSRVISVLLVPTA